MRYVFDCNDTRKDHTGAVVIIACYEGHAILARGASRREWIIDGIDLYGFKDRSGSEATVALAKDDPLYSKIALYLHGAPKHAQAMQDAWDRHLAQQRAEGEAA